MIELPFAAICRQSLFRLAGLHQSVMRWRGVSGGCYDPSGTWLSATESLL